MAVAVVALGVLGSCGQSSNSSTSDTADAERQLRAAIDASLAAESFRVVIEGSEEVGTVDYVAPDRVRSDGSDPFDGSAFVVITIGATTYFTNPPGSDTFSASEGQAPVPGVVPLYLLDRLEAVDDLRPVQGSDTRFSFRYDEDVYAPEFIAPGRGEVAFADGRIIELMLIPDVDSQDRVTFRYTKYGEVAAIEAPPPSKIVPLPEGVE